MQILDKLMKQPEVMPYMIAELYSGLGENDRAFTWLNKACDEHNLCMVSLKVVPTMDPLRDDPRFHELLRRMNLSRSQ